MKIKKLLSAVLCATLTFTLMACGSTGSTTTNVENGSDVATETETETTSSDKTLTCAIPSDPANISPVAAWTEAASPIITNVYAHLLYFQDGEPHLQVAESVEYTDDTHLAIKIRNDVKDQAGNELKASDVLFSMKLCQDGLGSCPTFVRYIDFDQTVVEDDYTLNVALTAPYAFQEMYLSSIALVTEAGYNASSDQMITDVCATGPYKVESFVAGSSVTLVPNEQWYGDTPSIDKVVFQVISETGQVTNGLETGEVQYATIQASDMEYIDSLPNTSSLALNTGMVYGLFFNCSSDSIFNSKEARQAVAYAFNKDSVNATALKGTGNKCISPVNTAFVDYTEKWQEYAAECGNYYETDLDKAKELADAAGLTNQQITIAYTSSKPVQKTISEMLQAQLAQIGVTANIQVYDDSVYVDTIKSNTDWDISVQVYGSLVNAGSACINSFVIAMNLPHVESAAYEEYTQLVSDILATVDTTERNEKTNQLIQKVDDEVIFLGLVESTSLRGIASDLTIGRYTMQGYPALETANWN